jgi:hypothetical protein
MRGSSCSAWHLVVTVNIAAILVVALVMRVWQLGHLPGINGDEAEYGVRAVRLLRGEPVVWHTPTGNAVNPFFFFPQVAIHALFAPSFTVLRVISVASGLTALALNFVLCRRLYGNLPATVSTVLLAVLPINIAYSRFAWDTCQTLAASTLVIYPALLMLSEPERRWRWFAVACCGYAAAYLVHPTNVFLGGFLAAVPVIERRYQWQPWLGRQGIWRWGAYAALAAGTAAFASWLGRTVFSIGVMDAVSPAGLVEFARNYGRLFNGVTVYRYLAGSHGPETAVGASWPYDFGWLDLLTLVAFAGSACVLCREIKRFERVADAGLLLGWLTTSVGFLLIAGPEAIRPHWERYGLCLILPGTLVVARAASILTARPGWPGRMAAATCLMSAWLLLIDFGSSYFGFIHRTGGESQQTFRTAAVEPKQAAFHAILAGRTPDRATHIVASEWWNYWPLAYLASAEPNVSVVWKKTSATAAVDWVAASNAEQTSSNTATIKPEAIEAHYWYVDFAESPAQVQHREELVDELGGWQERFVLDYADRPTLVLFAPLVSKPTRQEFEHRPYSTPRSQ